MGVPEPEYRLQLTYQGPGAGDKSEEEINLSEVNYQFEYSVKDSGRPPYLQDPVFLYAHPSLNGTVDIRIIRKNNAPRAIPMTIYPNESAGVESTSSDYEIRLMAKDDEGAHLFQCSNEVDNRAFLDVFTTWSGVVEEGELQHISENATSSVISTAQSNPVTTVTGYLGADSDVDVGQLRTSNGPIQEGQV